MGTIAAFIHELEKLDPVMKEPLTDFTWSRDIDTREDISFADEATSYHRISYGIMGAQTAQGKPWLTGSSKSLPSISVDAEKIVGPVGKLGAGVHFTEFELEASKRCGQDIAQQKTRGVKIFYQQTCDEQAYVGDTFNKQFGLFNCPTINRQDVANGAGGSPLWTKKTPKEILFDLNDMLAACAKRAGFARYPNTLRLAPDPYNYITSTMVSDLGEKSILTYLLQNNICNKEGQTLSIERVKWLDDVGKNKSQRMVAYYKDPQFVRLPIVQIQMFPVNKDPVDGIHYTVPYYWALGQVEFCYPETVIYRDGM